MTRSTSVAGLAGVLFIVLAPSTSACSTANCGQCDSAGKLEWCTDCTTDSCTETIQDKSTGKVVFTCMEKVGESCATSALVQYCDAQ